MSDLLRKIDNIKRIGIVAEVDNSAMPPMVRIEIDEGVLSDWMPYAMPFVGQTAFWCPAKIGVEGIVFSEGGENRICRFFPSFYNQSNAPAGLTDDDFMIFYKNGDTINHNSASNSLTINITDKTIVNANKTEVNAKESVVNAPKITLNGDTTVTKSLTVQGFTSMNGGFAMNRTNTRALNNIEGIINIPVRVNALMSYTVDPNIMGRKFLEHKHKGVMSGGDNTEEVS